MVIFEHVSLFCSVEVNQPKAKLVTSTLTFDYLFSMARTTTDNAKYLAVIYFFYIQSMSRNSFDKVISYNNLKYNTLFLR